MKQQEIIRAMAVLALLEESQQVKKNEEIVLKNIKLPQVMPSFDEIIRKDKKDLRQQHKYAVKFSNRRK